MKMKKIEIGIIGGIALVAANSALETGYRLFI